MGVRARWAVGLVLPAALVLGLARVQRARRARRRTRRPRSSSAPPTASSSQVLADLGLGRGRCVRRHGHARTPTPPRRAAVPDGFLPVSVVVCTPGGTLHDSSGHVGRR